MGAMRTLPFVAGTGSPCSHKHERLCTADPALVREHNLAAVLVAVAKARRITMHGDRLAACLQIVDNRLPAMMHLPCGA